jgi:hypothetical protein
METVISTTASSWPHCDIHPGSVVVVVVVAVVVKM